MQMSTSLWKLSGTWDPKVFFLKEPQEKQGKTLPCEGLAVSFARPLLYAAQKMIVLQLYAFYTCFREKANVRGEASMTFERTDISRRSFVTASAAAGAAAIFLARIVFYGIYMGVAL